MAERSVYLNGDYVPERDAKVSVLIFRVGSLMFARSGAEKRSCARTTAARMRSGETSIAARRKVTRRSGISIPVRSLGSWAKVGRSL